jgi:hypothetical protein
MIKYIYLIRRRPDVSAHEFRRLWESREFDDLVQSVVIKIGGYKLVKSLVLNIDFNKEMNARRNVDEPGYDAILEYVIDDAHDLNERIAREDFRKVFTDLETMEKRFIDLEHSQRYFIEGRAYSSDI